jgi:monovalent cation:H+ antiporter-2, CPA2 family
MPSHGESLIQDLGIIVACAAAASIIFRKLRLPTIFGYMAVGLLLGSSIFPSPIISDADTINQVSELGVMFLLFFMGMEFDLTKLRSVLSPAILAVVAQTIAMLFLSRLVSPLLGWGYLSSIFFGCLLAISSSMVTLRVLQDQGKINLPHAQLATGIMILEDILAVVMLVILSGIGVSRGFDWHAIWLVIFMMGVFVVGVYYFGRLGARKISSFISNNGDNEAITIISAGLALGVGALALKLNFSSALGAFVAGAILSKTKLVQSVISNNRSLRDLFCAVFFVTIGLQIDMHVVLANIWWVVALSALMIVGKIASCHLGMFLAGQSPEVSYNASASKAQIGEFSFVIVALAGKLDIIPKDERASLSAITFGVAFASILLTPLISSTSDRQYKWLAARAPRQLGRFAKFYRSYLDSVETTIGRNRLIRLIKAPLTQIVLYFFLISAIILGGAFIARWVSHLKIETPVMWGLLIWVSTAVVAVPFVIAIARNISTIIFMLTETIFSQRKAHVLMQGRVNNLVNTLATLLLLLLLGGFFLSVASPFLPRGSALAMFIILVVGIGFFFWRKMISINSRIEALFIDSFNEDIIANDETRSAQYIEKLAHDYPWPAEIAEIKLKAGSSVCGMRIRDLDLPRKTGSMIVALVRSGIEAFEPSPDVPLFPDDRLIVLGSNENNALAASILEENAATDKSGQSSETLVMDRAIVSRDCSLAGNTLAGSCIRRRFGVSVVGIQRGAQQIPTPRADEILKYGDMIIYVGSQSHAGAFRDFLHNERMEQIEQEMKDMPPPPTEAARTTE